MNIKKITHISEEAISALTNTTRLDIDDNRIIINVEYFEKLTHLECSCDSIISGNDLEKNINITHLNMSGCCSLNVISHLKKLTHLKFNGTNIDISKL